MRLAASDHRRDHPKIVPAWRTSLRRSALACLLVAMALVLASCSPPGPGGAIAEKIRAANSPMVREVVFLPLNSLEGGPERIVVHLSGDPSEAQELDLWCNVIIPAGGDQMPKGRIVLIQGEKPAPGGGFVGARDVLPDPVCPGAVSPSPS